MLVLGPVNHGASITLEVTFLMWTSCRLHGQIPPWNCGKRVYVNPANGGEAWNPGSDEPNRDFKIITSKYDARTRGETGWTLVATDCLKYAVITGA